jgi:flavorubredoxin
MVEVFKSKAIIVGSPTVNNSILSNIAGWLEFLKQLRFKNKKAAVFGRYGWSGESIKILQDKLKEAGFNVIDDYIKPLWKLNSNDINKIPNLVKNLLN